jgi:hypothetical protein
VAILIFVGTGPISAAAATWRNPNDSRRAAAAGTPIARDIHSNDDAYTTQLHKLSQAVLDAKLQVIEFTSEHSQAQQQTKKQKVDSDDE